MRSNGLTAATYTPVADLEPQLADAMLEDLRSEGVAAYTKPVESTTAAAFDRPEFRVGVKERLYVDSAAAERVRELISGRDPELAVETEDLRWAQLVAGFDRPLETAVAPWPANEELESEEGPIVDERDLHSYDRADGPPQVTSRPWGDRADRDAAAEDDAFLESTAHAREPVGEDERFVPDPPPPLPHLPPYKLLAWGGLIAGPLLLLVSAFFSYQLPGWASALAVLGFVGGFITLVATMGDGDDWDPDDGAVV
jgi:hypothetical protein